jgi:hypothetical protein
MKHFLIILLAGFVFYFGAASTAQAGGDGYRTYSRSTCGPSYYRGYYRSYNCVPRYHSYESYSPVYYRRPYDYGYCAPRIYHSGIRLAVPFFGFGLRR